MVLLGEGICFLLLGELSFFFFALFGLVGVYVFFVSFEGEEFFSALGANPSALMVVKSFLGFELCWAGVALVGGHGRWG